MNKFDDNIMAIIHTLGCKGQYWDILKYKFLIFCNQLMLSKNKDIPNANDE